jgi:hypothetical protein
MLRLLFQNLIIKLIIDHAIQLYNDKDLENSKIILNLAKKYKKLSNRQEKTIDKYLRKIN